MFDDFDLGNVDISEIQSPTNGSTAGYDNFQRQANQQQQPQQQQYQQQAQQQPQQQNYQQQPKQNYQNQQTQGGYNNNNNWQNRNNGNTAGGNRNSWPKKEEIIEEPYVPIAIYIDRDFPPEVKEKLIALSSRLINKNFVVRYNADDLEVHAPISGLSVKKTEAYTPWKNFNNIESKFSYNTATSKHVASTNFQGWDKVPDAVKSMLARNVRMVFGDKNRSTALCLITWSKDGASRAAEVNKDTGRSSFIIRLASTYGIPVVNIAKPNAEAALERAFNL